MTTTAPTHLTAKTLADYADYQAAGQRAGRREARRAFADDVRLTQPITGEDTPSGWALQGIAAHAAERALDDQAPDGAADAFIAGYRAAYSDELIARTQAATAAGEVEEELPPGLAAYAQALEAKEAKERAADASAQAGELARLRMARTHAQAWLDDLERRIAALEATPSAPTSAPVANGASAVDAPVGMPAPAPVEMNAPAPVALLI